MLSPFKVFLERKQRNPLRKQQLGSEDQYTNPEFAENYKNYWKNYPIDKMTNSSDKVIRKKYEWFKKNSPEAADKYIDFELKKRLEAMKRVSTKSYVKIYEFQGIQVFLDTQNVSEDYSKESYNYRIVRRNISYLLQYIKDIMPNRKPKIIITDFDKNQHTSDVNKRKREVGKRAMGISYNKHIFIDYRNIDSEDTYIHEYAHWVADLIPTQTQTYMVDAYKKIIKSFYTSKKKKNKVELSESDMLKISNHFKFPIYGFTNHDEFFAILIENWKKMPNNKLTYKFKSLVKNILTRL